MNLEVRSLGVVQVNKGSNLAWEGEKERRRIEQMKRIFFKRPPAILNSPCLR
jgi:hypothetical protein